MAVIKLKPTTPGQRGTVKISRDHLHKGAVDKLKEMFA